MGYFGDIRLSDTIHIKFCTCTTTGAPTQLAGSPVISAYPSNSTTQLTAGITLSVDFDSVTGLNNVAVVASGANGYLTATDYALIITTGTVGGTSVVGYEVGSFSIEHRSALMPTTAALTLDVSAGGEAGLDWANIGSKTTSNALTNTSIVTTQDVNAKTWNGLTTVALPLIPTTAGRTLDVSATGEAGVDWANVGSPTTANALTATSIIVTQKVDVDTIKTNPVVNGGTVTLPTNATLASTTNITAGTITTVGTVTTYTGNTPQTGDNYARLGAPAGASVSADIAADKAVDDAIKAKTDNLPAAPASTTNITAGTITTVTNLTNAPTAGDLTATMKASVATAALTTQMTESYAADGVAPTQAQALFLLISFLTEFAISSTTYTAKKLDGSTTSSTFTLDDATNPTSITRAT